MSIDKLDEKIIAALDSNSRIQISKLSKKLDLANPTVHYRFNNLLKNNIIKYFPTIINFSKLGYKAYRWHIKMKNMTHEENQKLLKYFTNMPNTYRIAELSSKYDYAITLICKNELDAYMIFSNFEKEFSKLLEKKVFGVILKAFYTPRRYLDVDEHINFSFDDLKEENLYVLDDIEFKILQILAKNARTSASSISKHVGLTPDNVSLRIQKLEKENIIQRYSMQLDLENFTYQRQKICLSLKNTTNVNLGKILEFCQNNLMVNYVNIMLCSWDIEIAYDYKNRQALKNILYQFNTQFKDIIKEYFILDLHTVHKRNFFPIGS